MVERMRSAAVLLPVLLCTLVAATSAGGARVYAWGDTVDRVATAQMLVALTFDDGPREPYTSQILDVLRAQGVRATFFLVGENVARYPEVARRIVREGHAVGNHSWSHKSQAEVGADAALSEVVRGQQAILRATGIRPWMFRPPFGATGPGHESALRATRSLAVMWSVEARDWSLRTPHRVAVRTLRQVGPGDIVLLHDGGGPREHVVTATRWMVGHLSRLGYRLVTVPELLEHAR